MHGIWFIKFGTHWFFCSFCIFFLFACWANVQVKRSLRERASERVNKKIKGNWRIERRWVFISFLSVCVSVAYASAPIHRFSNGIDFKMILRIHFKPNMKRCDQRHWVNSIEYFVVFVQYCLCSCLRLTRCALNYTFNMWTFIMSTVWHVPYVLLSLFRSWEEKKTFLDYLNPFKSWN